MKTILFILFQFMILTSVAQVKISGTVLSDSGKPVSGVNVFIQGLYDGCTTDSLGQFQFKTDLSGDQTLIASFVGFKTQAVPLDLKSDIQILKKRFFLFKNWLDK